MRQNLYAGKHLLKDSFTQAEIFAYRLSVWHSHGEVNFANQKPDSCKQNTSTYCECWFVRKAILFGKKTRELPGCRERLFSNSVTCRYSF